jgi:hypothetical protein
MPFRVRRRQRSWFRNAIAVWRALDVRTWNVVALFVLAALVVAYLALTNGNATAGYELRSLERSSEALHEEARQLELQSLSMQSIDAITARVADQGFVPVAHVRYLAPSDRSVATR